MRQLTISVPTGYGEQLLKLTADCHSFSQMMDREKSLNGDIDKVTMTLSNRRVGDLLEAVERNFPSAEVSLSPSAVLSLHLPSNNVPQALTEVQPRSPIEIFLDGVQSIGSWPSFLTYAAAAGAVVWIGLYTNSVFLLVASMLIAPFGGPAMNVVIASARGDFDLLKRSIFRYFAALSVIVAAAWLLSTLFGQTIATDQMVATSEVSSAAVLLPLAGGIAGAVQLAQSERSSLVSGAAIGMLVAAALAPPAGLVGMAIAIGRPDMAINGGFLLLLQLVGINFGGAIVFRLYGLQPGGAVYAGGKRRVFPIALWSSILALAFLLSWQFSSSPNLTRSSLAQKAMGVIQTVVDGDPDVSLVESNVRFTRPNIPDQNTLLSSLYIQPKAGQTVDVSSARRRLIAEIQNELLSQGFNVTPLIDITVLDLPADTLQP